MRFYLRIFIFLTTTGAVLLYFCSHSDKSSMFFPNQKHTTRVLISAQSQSTKQQTIQIPQSINLPPQAPKDASAASRKLQAFTNELKSKISHATPEQKIEILKENLNHMYSEYLPIPSTLLDELETLLIKTLKYIKESEGLS